LPILGEIPEKPSLARGRQGQPAIRNGETQTRLIAHHAPQSSLAEAYRCLRTSLAQCSGKALKTLAITSCLPSEGKTTTAINCAVVLAQQGKKVLLVDADLRRSSVHEAFGLPQDPGLTGLLSHACTAEEALRSTELMPNLTVLPAGAASPFPAEMLASPQMSSLLERWRAQYDHVIFDTPPTSMFTDAVILGSRADTTLLVARAGCTTKYALRHACGQMLRAKVNVAGVVLNRIDKTYERSYYHRYGYGLASPAGRMLDN
jgi:capsular exopolysaccharide synthesis family protein